MKPILTSIVLILFSTVNSQKLKLLKFEKCDPDVEYQVDIYSNIVEENGQQYSKEGWLKTPIPLGHDVELLMEVSIFENDKFNHFMTLKRDLCIMIYKYAPEMVYELEDIVGIERDACPIPAGEYKVENYPIDFNKIKINKDLIDDGAIIRAVTNLMDTATNSSLVCTVAEILKTNDE